MQTKKRFLSILMAAVMMLSLAPAAFAAENQHDTVTLPNGETVEVPEVTMLPTPAATDANVAAPLAQNKHLKIEGSSYYVYDAEGLIEAGSYFTGTKMTVSTIYLSSAVIDFSNVAMDEDYIFHYFAGTIKSDPALGTRAVIKGLPENKALIHTWVYGTLSNFDVDLDGKPSRLALLPATSGGSYLSLKMENIDVYSGSKDETANKPVVLTTADAEANYAPFAYATGGVFNMTNCTNYADISSSSYGSVFYGCYPVSGGKITFTNCINKGTISMRHAAMFFGNNSAFLQTDVYAFNKAAPEMNRIQFVGCKNEGFIKGTESANLFSTRAGGRTDPIGDDYEEYLRSDTVGCMEKGSVELLGQNLGMALYSDANGNLTMTPATPDKNVAHYVVSVYSYVNVFNNSDGSWYGTTRFGVSQELDATEPYDITVKKYGVCDYEPGTLDLQSETGEFKDMSVVTYRGKPYYWMDSYELRNGGEFYWGVSRTEPFGHKDSPDIVTLAAYSANWTLLGTVTDVSASVES